MNKKSDNFGCTHVTYGIVFFDIIAIIIWHEKYISGKCSFCTGLGEFIILLLYLGVASTIGAFLSLPFHYIYHYIKKKKQNN